MNTNCIFASRVHVVTNKQISIFEGIYLVLGGDADESENKQGIKRWINQCENEQKLFFLGVFNTKKLLKVCLSIFAQIFRLKFLVHVAIG
jgi:hypothetical protein